MNQKHLTLAEIIAKDIQVSSKQVEAAIVLMDDGATVPFIARYRKEVTGGLDDIQLRTLADRLQYLRDLDERRKVILNSLREQGVLTDELAAHIQAADTKNRLEDIYLPFRPKRRTKASIAKEAGLEPLSQLLRDNPAQEPEQHAQAFVNAELGVADVAAALEGACHILLELFAEDPTLIDEMREFLWKNAVVQSKAVATPAAASNNKSKKKAPKQDAAEKYSDYFDYAEPIRKIPSHRALALFRGRRENFLQLSLELSAENESYPVARMQAYFHIEDQKRPGDVWLLETIRLAWKTKLSTKLESELFARLREKADEAAIQVFALNLRALLLNAPAGHKRTIGLDPGIRTGVKVVVVDETGKLLDYTTIFPFPPQNESHQAMIELAKLASKYQVQLISIGNGTGSRETERLVAELIKTYPDLGLIKVLVSEAGASVYSASELASNEFPDVDVSIRGAISIARRLQDPLAELVKIEPKSIGVGQYQHDVNQLRLSGALHGIVEDCVNAVGVDINTASVPLLTYVAGLHESLAKNIVEYRDAHGAFSNREQIKAIPRMGDKTFQQAAGFLRIMHGDNPLDASAVHPEAYPLVEKIAQQQAVAIDQLIGNQSLLASLEPQNYVDAQFGLPTIRDILTELEKPGRDPRPAFKTVEFKAGIETIQDLEAGLILDGVVSNVTNFGAFVDIGVHQDGLVHISELKKGFVADPSAILKPGDIVTVKVKEVDKERKRISLSMKLENEVVAGNPARPQIKKDEKKIRPRAQSSDAPKSGHNKSNKNPSLRSHDKKQLQKDRSSETSKPKNTVFNTSMADAFARLKQGANNS